MTQLSTVPDAPDAGEQDSIGRVGREIIRQVDMDRLAALIERRAASILLEELANILKALELADPRSTSRRAGIIGRLLGRDLAGQARARQAHQHVHLRLQLAARRAQDVRTHIAELDDAISHIGRQRARLAEIADRGRGAIDAFSVVPAARPDAMARRLQHLAVLISSWDVAAAHMRLVRQYGELLLARFNHITDVAVPAWQALSEGALISGHVEDAGPLREALSSLLDSTSLEPAALPPLGDLRV